MKGKLTLLLLIIVAGWLAFSNPTMEDFKTFTHNQSRDYLEDELGDNAIGRALAQAGSSLAGDYIDQIADRKNYIFFSRFTIGDTSEAAESEDSWSYLGIAGRFIRTDSN